MAAMLWFSIVYLIHLSQSCTNDPNLTDYEVWQDIDGGWNYYDCGPSQWGTFYPDYCGSSYTTQSPINIDTDDVTSETLPYDDIFDIWQWDASKTTWIVENNGHSLHLTSNDSTVANLTTVQSGSYNLYGIHFHWGNTSAVGSEHTIDGETYPLEIHFVHFHNQFSDIVAAIDDNMESNLAAIGILFELSDDDNEYLDLFLNNVSDIRDYDTMMLVDDLSIYHMLTMSDNDFDSFWYYEGSLTTPPCDPIVRWYVLEDKLTISEAQLNRFRVLLNNDNDTLHQNWRPVQENTNNVTYYVMDGSSSATDGGERSRVVLSGKVVCAVVVLCSLHVFSFSLF